MDINLKSLIGKLNDFCRTSLEAAAGLCLSNTHYQVEIEHIMIKMLEQDTTDIHCILRHYEIDDGRVLRELVQTINDFKSGNTRTPVLSPRIPDIVEKAWLGASLLFNAPQVRTGHILLTLISEPEFKSQILESVPSFKQLPKEEIKENFHDLTKSSNESTIDVSDEGGAEPRMADMAKKGMSKTPGLDQYTVNLSEKAKSGEIDPVLGRDEEIRQIVDILTRRRQNNPILTGEAGVGKTAVVEGFALRIIKGDVPPQLKNVVVHSLDLGSMQAGASVKGEFENRMKMVIEEVKKSPHPIVMFIDEAHTLIGAGGQAGQSDAANLLKPALARGELRTIAATTWSEYKKYFEKDVALARRFQVVKVDEPSEEKAIAMLRGIADIMENHHNVRILDEAIIDAVKFSHRYITARQLPDKAVSVLDTACARVGISQAATPGPVEDALRKIDIIDTEMSILEREESTGSDHKERLKELKESKSKIEKELEILNKKWDEEKEIVESIREVRTALDEMLNGDKPKEDKKIEELKKALKAMNAKLEKAQGDEPLIHVEVTGQTVGEVISGWTGIPIGKMLADEIETVKNLEHLMAERVIGQDHALNAIAHRVQTSRAALDDPNKPIGVFMLVGTSGVGKTETALALADILYGGEHNMITINMSEYQEAHTVSGLKGSPPGYVGYGEGGALTEPVRRKPYSVVLLDEVEKAHPDVLELFFQVFDKGRMDDAEGRQIDFKNTIIILTSNVGTDTIMKACNYGKERPPTDQLLDLLRPELNDVFKPAFVGRTVTIPFYPISDEILSVIINLKLGKIKKRIADNHKAELEYGDDLVKLISERCTEVDSGARNVDNILTGTVLPSISEAVLEKMAKGEAIKKVKIGVKNGELDYKIT